MLVRLLFVCVDNGALLILFTLSLLKWYFIVENLYYDLLQNSSRTCHKNRCQANDFNIHDGFNNYTNELSKSQTVNVA